MSIARAVRDLLEDQGTSSCEAANAHMTPDVYAQLRLLASNCMRGERAGHTLQATAIVNEAYLRLGGVGDSIRDRAHFFRMAAQAMRNILVDHARAKRRMKREIAAQEEVELLCTPSTLTDHLPLDILDLDRALTELGHQNPRGAQFVEQHYLIGLSCEELALAHDVSLSTVERELRFARAWLLLYCKQTPSQGSSEGP